MANPNATIQKLEARKAQLEARLVAAKARQAKIARSLDTRRKILVGAAVLEARAQDPRVAEWLAAILHGFLTRDPDRRTCKDLLFVHADPRGPDQQRTQISSAG